MEFRYLQQGGVFSGVSSEVEFRYLQQGGVYSGMCSEQQGGVPLSPTGWGLQRHV